jgi:hypothetical protein
VQTQFNRQQHADLFLSTILEGPHTWKVRPVAEIAYEDDVGTAQTFSGLIGLIWQVRAIWPSTWRCGRQTRTAIP